MENFSEIFQAMIQDHGRRPRHFGKLESPSHRAEGVNPITGDTIEIYISLDDAGVIESAQFAGKMSSLATTSASVMTGKLIGLDQAAALELIDLTLKRFKSEQLVPDDLPEDEYSVLLEIRHVPNRIRCASLAWNTAAVALSVN